MAGNLQLCVTQTLPRTRMSGVTVVADEDIVSIVPDMRSNPVSFFTIKACFEDAGALYVHTDDGYDEYLTSPDTEWPAKLQIVATYVMDADRTGTLRFTNDTTASSIIICEGSGVY